MGLPICLRSCPQSAPASCGAHDCVASRSPTGRVVVRNFPGGVAGAPGYAAGRLPQLGPSAAWATCFRPRPPTVVPTSMAAIEAARMRRRTAPRPLWRGVSVLWDGDTAAPWSRLGCWSRILCDAACPAWPKNTGRVGQWSAERITAAGRKWFSSVTGMCVPSDGSPVPEVPGPVLFPVQRGGAQAAEGTWRLSSSTRLRCTSRPPCDVGSARRPGTGRGCREAGRLSLRGGFRSGAVSRCCRPATARCQHPDTDVLPCAACALASSKWPEAIR